MPWRIVAAISTPVADRAWSLEIATTATASDLDEHLSVEGGEGDCVEIDRDDFDRIRALVLQLTRPR